MLPVICIAQMSFLHLQLKKENNVYAPLIAIIIISIIRAGTIYASQITLFYSYVYNIALPIIMLSFALLELYLYFAVVNNSTQRRTSIAYIMNLISSDIFKCLYGFIYILNLIMTCVMTLNACVYIVSIPMGNDILAANFAKTQTNVKSEDKSAAVNSDITITANDNTKVAINKTTYDAQSGSISYDATINDGPSQYNIVIIKKDNTYTIEQKEGTSQFNGTLTITDSQNIKTQLSITPSLILKDS
jgi:hypothetical protein